MELFTLLAIVMMDIHNNIYSSSVVITCNYTVCIIWGYYH